jgi:hypothetical protein
MLFNLLGILLILLGLYWTGRYFTHSGEGKVPGIQLKVPAGLFVVLAGVGVVAFPHTTLYRDSGDSPVPTSTASSSSATSSTTTSTSPPTTARPTTTTLPLGQPIALQGEEGEANGPVMPRGAASNERTRLLHAGQTLRFRFPLLEGRRYRSIIVRYSNDNFGAREQLKVSVDRQLRAQFAAEDTGDGGRGWNVFREKRVQAPLSLKQGSHTLSIAVSGGDGYGVEIDSVTLSARSS